MKPWTPLDRAAAPGGGELTLLSRDGEYVIRVDGHVLMSSRSHGSEQAMARAALDGRPLPARPRWLVGGLGLGYTLRAVLDALPPAAEVVVGELSAAVIAWNRGPLADLAARPLDDPRVQVVEGDVVALLSRNPARFDALLLDIDNGSTALTSPGNRTLYADRGIALCRAALSPGGRLVVWSAGPDRAYVDRLRAGGFDARAEPVKARSGGAARHVLFIGERR